MKTSTTTEFFSAAVTMKLKILIEVGLILVLAYNSEGKEWAITVEREIVAGIGCNVTIPCIYSCPDKQCISNINVQWKKRVRNNNDANDNNLNEFVFEKNGSLVQPRYKGKTKLVSEEKYNCTLRIQNITTNDEAIYVRIEANPRPFSFYDYNVSITVKNENCTESSPDNNPSNTETQTTMYLAIFIPLGLLLIFLFTAGIYFLIKHKRRDLITREESGYYANFSRASSNNTKSEVSSKKTDILPEINNTDDPVYVNLEIPSHMDRSPDQSNSVYANVNYSK